LLGPKEILAERLGRENNRITMWDACSTALIETIAIPTSQTEI
jgi:hypothetical protein